MKLIDLRSDTVTKPSADMLKYMISVPVGDDVYGEDPTVRKLEELMMDQTGMAAAVFAPTGTQSNLLALLSHCQRGDEYIVGQTAHTYMFEGGGAAVLGSIQPQPLDFNPNGTLDLNQVYLAIKPDDSHYARTKLLCLENTTNGKVLPLQYLQQIPDFCKKHNLASHLDGARAYNAAVELNLPLKSISSNFDSISICLSKGLGTPMGSVLCGSTSLIKQARKWRKMLGGGMRQIGIMAAAGIYALEHNLSRLTEDHKNARLLAQYLAAMPQFELITVNTNILFVKCLEKYTELREYLMANGIIFPNTPNKLGQIRLITHLDITKPDIEKVIEQITKFYNLTNK